MWKNPETSGFFPVKRSWSNETVHSERCFDPHALSFTRVHRVSAWQTCWGWALQQELKTKYIYLTHDHCYKVVHYSNKTTISTTILQMDDAAVHTTSSICDNVSTAGKKYSCLFFWERQNQRPGTTQKFWISEKGCCQLFLLRKPPCNDTLRTGFDVPGKTALLFYWESWNCRTVTQTQAA